MCNRNGAPFSRRFSRAEPYALAETTKYRLKNRVLGKPVRTEELAHERLGKPTALAVFASDNLSSRHRWNCHRNVCPSEGTVSNRHGTRMMLNPGIELLRPVEMPTAPSH